MDTGKDKPFEVWILDTLSVDDDSNAEHREWNGPFVSAYVVLLDEDYSHLNWWKINDDHYRAVDSDSNKCFDLICWNVLDIGEWV